MDTNKLKKFAQEARIQLISQVSARLTQVLAEGSAARREAPVAVAELEKQLKALGQPQLIEKVAYTWFNRFTALRFMDANGYTNPRVVTPAEGQTRPEILADAAAGQYDDTLAPRIRDKVISLLDGRTPSHDAQGEAYRLLLVAACNHWHGPMAFMFEKITDYTELLLPDDLLSPESVLASLREAMTDTDAQDVEVIGWLYQFYISQKKDDVFAALKKNVKITAENIPAATQLFTPHWIVRYLVENSLGRLWLLNRPTSNLAAQMDYYIAPVEAETDFLRISSPEEIKICDPACGSGHMLTYAFDLLYAIYEEEGYDANDIPALILTHNLTGIEIDDRAGALAAFALTMKAAQRLGRRRFLRMEARPNIVVMQDIHFTESELADVQAVVGRDLWSAELRETLTQFEQAKNFGSLIVPKLRDPAEVLRVVQARDFSADLMLRTVQERVVALLQTAEALAPKYHVVVANPPYMGGKGMNSTLNIWLKTQYPDTSADLFSAFVERGSLLVVKHGAVGIMSPNVWMYLSSYLPLRNALTKHHRLRTLFEMPLSAFKDATVQICGFIFDKETSSAPGDYFRLLSVPPNNNGVSEALKEAIIGRRPDLLFRSNPDNFSKIPGNPIAYWTSERLQESFLEPPLSQNAEVIQGIITGDTNKFIRDWYEVNHTDINFESHSSQSSGHWIPYLKGGDGRKWYGNQTDLLNWRNQGADLVRARTNNKHLYFRPCITWTRISSAGFSCRASENGFLWDVNGSIAVPRKEIDRYGLLGLMCSKVSGEILDVLAPTISKNIENIAAIPVQAVALHSVDGTTRQLIALARTDWDAFETSWDFTAIPLLAPDHRGEMLAASYRNLRSYWQGMTDEMQRLEEENNRIFIEAYGLQDELTPDVPIEEITLTCNPAYRYGVKISEEDREARLREDTVAELLHYAVGCMFGRYSLDAPGLILANQGEGIAEYLARVPNPSFAPDRDNVIPVLDADWFADDIVSRIREFIRITFGEAKLQENLDFIEGSLGKDLRKWFTKDFYEYHVRRYKKRPIYWMFSSPKGTFNALIYMHRYRGDTVSVLLNDYLRELISKLQTRRVELEKRSTDPNASAREQTAAVKEVALVIKQIAELEEWEREVIFPLAQRQIEIDLDDGVKRNYPLFGEALKKIKGLEASDD
ncbi:BREX-1 system adenine-specific DNA-methyltransferase PglX [Xinfangfangia sp. CPCC 101601]|uniref:site-specific DNA-methyltransferase (adenine-specific) n=1 Tax=Pseudogemmobacter lacusdianii TaxID=3069608 RepID=A0ABU0W2L8_9RHOB|nr:BREX-1 system adenine-specific DNA-methyltransferase PglX [Xinfangfangia sp. CPCC 101601]MDQ2068211.1 BREX-1 system adenine-specific DNA-methyltransferase PglX [Xinfangfangia sp. CPCC 101601]